MSPPISEGGLTSNYSGVYEVSRVSALRSESEAAQTIPIRDFQSLKPAFLRDPLNGYSEWALLAYCQNI